MLPPVSPLAINSQTYSKITTVIDSTIATSTSTFAVRGLSSESTVFLSGKDLYAYVKQFAVEGAPTLHEVDIAALPAKVEKEKKEKEDAKIEGAIQIAIGVKKEVDFPTWYTNVLLKADMLDYYNVSGCYILKPWSYSIWEIIQGHPEGGGMKAAAATCLGEVGRVVLCCVFSTEHSYSCGRSANITYLY